MYLIKNNFLEMDSYHFSLPNKTEETLLIEANKENSQRFFYLYDIYYVKILSLIYIDIFINF